MVYKKHVTKHLVLNNLFNWTLWFTGNWNCFFSFLIIVRNGKSECSLSIQTQHNLPVNLNEFVKCLVISSLVTTQRKLKAMSLLSGRSQLARAVLNPNPMDFCTKDLLTTASERIVSDSHLITGKVRTFHVKTLKHHVIFICHTFPFVYNKDIVTMCAQWHF